MLSLVLDARSDESLDDSLGDELAEDEVVGGAVELDAFRDSLGVSPDGMSNITPSGKDWGPKSGEASRGNRVCVHVEASQLSTARSVYVGLGEWKLNWSFEGGTA